MPADRSRPRVAVPVAFAVALAVVCTAPAAFADNWPAFRGADGRSVSSETGLPVEWGPQKNVRWRVDLPGKSNGSPVVWGDRVFVAQAVEKENRRTVMCFDRKSGKLLWQSGITYAEKESTHPDNPPCSGTPATDGQRVVACFGSAGLVCYDFAGKELWRRDLGKLNHMFGNAISPVIVGDLVIVNFGPGEGTRLVAVDKRTGNIAWETKPPKVDPSEQTMSGPRMGGPAMMVLMGMGPADKNEDAMLSREELAALADAWFDKLDPQKKGKVNKEQFVEKLNDAIPPPPGSPDPAGFKPGPIVGPQLFGAADVDKDGSLTRQELKDTFATWHAKWGGGKDEPLDFNQMLDGLNAIIPARKGPPPGAGPAPGPGGPPGAPGFGGEQGPGGSWTTPIVIRTEQRDELVVAFPNRLAAYDPRTGRLLWFSKGLPDSAQPMPLWADKEKILVASGGDMSGGTMLALRVGDAGSGGGNSFRGSTAAADVTDSRRIWRQTRLKGNIGTGVVHDGRIYSVSSDGFAACFDLKTGNRLRQKRLEGSGDKRSSWSSLLLADGKIYVPNQAGDVFVLRAGPEFEVLATNSVDEPTNTTLAASDGQLFLRTDKGLWCIGK